MVGDRDPGLRPRGVVVLANRAWLAKALSLGAWFLLGAFLIQVRTQPLDEFQRHASRILTVADGRGVTLTARVLREGYARADGARQIREAIDVETEEIASQGESWPVHAGERLTLYEKVANSEAGSSAHVVIEDRGPLNFNDPIPRCYSSAARAYAFAPSGIRRATTATPEPLIMKVTCATTASAYWPRRRQQTLSDCPAFPAAGLNFGARAFHASIVAKIHQLWPASQASLMDAMILGEESFSRNATRVEYQRSGTYHVLVVSGMNLSILAFAMFWTLR